MKNATTGLAIAACGVAITIAGVSGWLDRGSLYGVSIGLLMSLVGVAVLLSGVRASELTTPDRYVSGVVGLGAVLHLYENLAKGSGPSFAWFAWTMFPYALALAISCIKPTRRAATAGAAAALLVDLWVYHGVFVVPRGSTEPLAFLFAPLWNSLIVVPVGTWAAWLIQRKAPGPIAAH
ncbi:hypothetical protein HNQ60_004393 [Povalibacter uvarum]|uniref:Uncharacterized protein n=1 Tax=Povalibacter uvarum TaxID=732238 RepID=A0A841HRW1_9GAMM|nr:hypothetical protein [Povalibacter uvarum]MBB6095503.1 hypothetical protein [Povalibacter uvarum]